MSRILSHSTDDIRPLTGSDLTQVRRLLQTSEYAYQRFALEELPALLSHYPAPGAFHGTSLRGFILSQTVRAPSAWIGGFCVSWTESRSYLKLLDTLLTHLYPLLLTRGVRYLHYSGNDDEQDWLRDALLARGFIPYRSLYSYDKFDYRIPATGNREITTRPAEPRDIPALLAIDVACFEELWRYDAVSFIDILATHPYFVVAEINGKIIGYQFNALEDEYGFLVRIAVHPSASGQGIGIRLMAEAIRFFESASVSRIMLNTQEDNVRAHSLYEWFGFERIQQMGFVLRKAL